MSKIFENKTALIVGGTSGIGLETAKMLLQSGAKTVIIGRTAEKLKKALDNLRFYGEVEGWQSDISGQNRWQEVVKRVENDLPDVELLVNSAGIFVPKPFIEQTPEDYDSYLDINR